MIYLQLLIISLITIYVIDFSGFYEAVSSKIAGLLTHGKNKSPFYIKPFSCSRCMTLWLGLLWILISGSVTFFTVAYCFLLSWLAPTFKDIMQNVEDCLSFFNAVINNILSKRYKNG